MHPHSVFESGQRVRHRAVRAIVLGLCATLVHSASVHAQTLPSDSHKSQVIKNWAPDGPTSVTVEFDVTVKDGDGDGDGRTRENLLGFSSLRSTVGIAMISLINPSKRVVWRKTPEELGITLRNLAHQPALGDSILLPSLRDAPLGRWALKIERSPRSTGAGQILFAYQVLPRFALTMSMRETRAAAGQPMMLVLRPTDYGAAVTGLGPIDVRVLDAQGARVAAPVALAGARSPTSIPISDEPGAYIARFSLPKAGDYRLEAQQRFSGRYGPLMAHTAMDVKVDVGNGALALSGVQFERSPTPPGAVSCVSAVIFDFAVDVAAAGTYACNVGLVAQGSTAARRFVSGSAALPKGGGRIAVKANAATLRALGGPLTQLHQVGLIHYSDHGGGLIAEMNHVPLTSAQQAELTQRCPQ